MTDQKVEILAEGADVSTKFLEEIGRTCHFQQSWWKVYSAIKSESVNQVRLQEFCKHVTK